MLKFGSMSTLFILKIFNLICFFGYGFSCLFSEKMKKEFSRYGLAHFRRLTGLLQIAGSLGLVAGFYFEPLTKVAALGLSVLMFLGVGVRIKIRDPFLAIVPAFVFMCLNFIIFLIEMNLILDFQLVF
jgi:hypothetical protein